MSGTSALHVSFGMRRLMAASALVALGLAGMKSLDNRVALASILTLLVGPPIALSWRRSPHIGLLVAMWIWTVPVSLLIVLYVGFLLGYIR